MNLKKDREDQSKYYLSYPKPPVLDIKWENHDINVEGWANIPKFLPLLNGDTKQMHYHWEQATAKKEHGHFE